MKVTRRARAVVSVALLPLVSACVMPDDVAKLQKDVVDVQQQLRRTERDQADLQSRLDEMETRSGDEGEPISREELAETQLQLGQMSRQLSIVTERISDLEQRLDRYSRDARQPRQDVRLGPPSTPDRGPLDADRPGPDDGSPARPTAEAFPDPEALYNTAYADFSKGNYSLAVSGFREYHQRFSDSALADNALYWIAECHFSQGDYRAAVDALDDLLERHPDSDKAPAANLKKALAFQEQNQIEKAIIQYRYVVSAFPDTDEARLARDKLTGLGTSPN
jgi:tol-pal system protein YbgF